MQKLALIVTFLGIFYTALPHQALSEDLAPNPEYSFELVDKSHSFKAKIFSPEELGDWTINEETPAFHKKLTPEVVVLAYFQNNSDPSLYGLIRAIPDLKGTDCATAFKAASEADNLQLLKSYEKITDTGEKKYSQLYGSPERKIVTGNKIICNEQKGVEFLIVTPDDSKKYGKTLKDMVHWAELSILDN